MRTSRRVFVGSFLMGCGAVFAAASRAQPAMPNMPSSAKMPNMVMPGTTGTARAGDPAGYIMIVNRDSNDISFMDIATKRIVGRTFLGNNVNPHMVMMSPDGRYVVTAGTRSNTAFIIDSQTFELVKILRTGIGPEHLSFSPDSRYWYQGNPSDDSITVFDMQSMTTIRTIEGLAEPLNVTFTPDGTKAYIGNYGAHWVGVIDVTRHELLKKIQIDQVPGVSRLNPNRYLGEIKGISNATLSADGRYVYCADGDLGVVGVIDTRDDRVVSVIRVGQDPWRLYMSHDGRYGITINNGDETISIINTQTNQVAATFECGPDMTGVNFAAGKAFVISSTTGFLYVYNMQTLRPAGRIKIGTPAQVLQIQTATTDAADQFLYLASATDNSVYIVNAQTEAVERVPNVGLYPWGTHVMHSKDNYCH